MSIEAKITPADKPVAQGAEQAINNSISIAPGENIALDVAPDMVQSMAREGSDLVLQLKDGQAIRIGNFYGAADKASHLYLVENEQLVSANLSSVASSGAVSASYTPVGAAANFSSLAEGAAAAAAGGAGGGLSTAAILGGVALAGGGVAAAAGGGGGGDNAAPPTTVTPPSAATRLAISGSGTQLTGSAAAGTTVRIDTNGDGTPEATATVGSDGNFTVTLNPPLTDGQTVSVTVVNSAGNSAAASVIAPDTTPPPPPSGVQVSANGLTVTGAAAAGSTIRIDVNGDGVADATATVGANGQFTATLPQPLTNGETISVRTTDAAGNASAPITATAPDTTPPPPPSGVQVSGDGTQVMGTAEAGSTIRVDTNGDGIADATATTGSNGQFTVTLPQPMTDGETISVVAVDTNGNNSTGTTATAPDLAPGPNAPVIDPSNGSVFTGTARPGVTVFLRIAGGRLLGQATVGADGHWSITPTAPLPNATVVVATAQDSNGVSGPSSSTATDSFPPADPVIAPTNGTQISGTAEAGGIVRVTDSNGNAVGQTTADSNGNWAITPPSPLPDGTVINTTVTDPLGNVSDTVPTTVDAAPPAPPAITPTNGASINGTAEAGSTVTLTDGNGNPIGQVVVAQNGTFAFIPATPLADGTVVRVTASDPAGNVSPVVTVTVDMQAPDVPTIDPSRGNILTGTAEAGANLTLLLDGTSILSQFTVPPDGNWSFTPGSPLLDGAVVTVRATDPTGNAGQPATITIDATAPDAPLVDPSNGFSFSGTAEAGSIVTLTDGGIAIGQVTADSDGNWIFTPASPLPNGEAVDVTATDAAGNVSIPAAVTVDAFPPLRPRILRTNGRLLFGRAEAFSRVIVTDGDGDSWETTADANGNWMLDPGAPLDDDTVLSVTSFDAAGNQSESDSTTVDITLPATPAIAPTNGTIIRGTADAGNIIIVTDANGIVIGQTTADGSGNWSITPVSPLPNGTVVEAVAQDADGVTTDPVSTVVDSVPPAAPVLGPTNGTVITGTAEAGAVITLTDGNGNPIGQTVVGLNGRWSFSPASPLADGTQVRAIATDAAGNAGPLASATVDGVPPPAPVIAPTNGASLQGTGEIGAVILLTGANGATIGTTIVNGNGRWSFAPSSPLPNGTTVQAVARDAAGNLSGATTAMVDSIPPASPVINPSNGALVTGTAEAGSLVALTNGSGALIGTTTTDVNGRWSYTPTTPLANGTVVSAVALDAAGNISGLTSTSIDSIPPLRPVIAPTNGATITGTAEAGALLTLTDGNGNPIGQTTVAANGRWTFAPASPLPNGTVVNAIASDAAGNASPSTSATVDAVAPAAPVLLPSNGGVVTGTAEAGSTVTLRNSGGALIGTAQANSVGVFAFFPSPALIDGTVVIATATDASGNISPSSSVTVDTLPPLNPVIDPSNGLVFTGTAEAGVIILLTDSGVLIGRATVDVNGNWSLIPNIPLIDGTIVVAVAQDGSGNLSASASTTVDALAPVPPVILPTNGATLSGAGEVGATIILTDGNGNPIGQATVGLNGQWSFTPATPLANGTVVNVTASDALGNVSAGVSVTVDTLPPGAPVILPSNGTVLTGTAEAASTVTLNGPGGVLIGTTITDINGNWRFTPALALPDGTVVNATAIDASGNASIVATATIDATPPPIPFINYSDGAVLSGTAEAGAVVTLTDGNGNPIGQTTADINGNWSFTPGTQLADGTVVLVTATDPAGNVSLPTAVTIDDIAPPPPVIQPTRGVTVIGTAEAGATVTLTDGNGNPIGQTTADILGNWTFTPASPLPHNSVINATATDVSGNVSLTASTTVDALPPNPPVVLPTNGLHLVGTAEAGAIVILSVGGIELARVSADVNGHWAFAPTTGLLNGTLVTVIASDIVGNVSTGATITVDTSQPSIPVVQATGGISFSGTADANNAITILDQVGNVIGTTTANALGNWSITFGSPLLNGAIVRVFAENGAGTDSQEVRLTIDTIAPAQPVILPSRGTLLSGTAEAGATILLTDGNGAAIATVTADLSGNWSFTPSSPLAHGLVVNVVARDASANVSLGASVTVDSIAPSVPVILPTSGAVLSGTAEAGATITLTGPGGLFIGQVTADISGTWNFAPLVPLVDGVVVNATASDISGNVSAAATVTVDTIAPVAPGNLVISADGSLLTGIAEANSQVRIVVNGNVANPITATVGSNGTFSVPLSPPLTLGQELSVTVADAAANISLQALVRAPDLVQPLLSIAEAADGFLNKVEASDGLQVNVGLTAATRAGDIVTLHFVGQGGITFDQTHIVTAGEKAAGTAAITILPPIALTGFPEGSATVTANIGSGPASAAVGFTVDTINPATPVLSLVGDVLTIAGAPGETLTVDVALAGLTVSQQVTANGSGLASLSLLTGLSIAPSWADLLTASVSVHGTDAAGNLSNVATVGVGAAIDLNPVTLGGFGLNVALIPPALGFRGTAPVGGTLSVEVVTPAATVTLHPIIDSGGNYSVNLLSASLLSQLGLSITQILNLGAGIGLNVIATDASGRDSAHYGVSLLGSGLSLNIGAITVSGSADNDILRGRDGQAETINAGLGSDFILHVGAGDIVNAGSGNDTIQLSGGATGHIDGGAGIDTILFDPGININYATIGAGSWSGIERVDLGKDNGASSLTLTAAHVNQVTDGGNVLQITGGANDTLTVAGAVNTGTSVTLNGTVYDVYTFGAATLQIEHNSVIVVH